MVKIGILRTLLLMSVLALGQPLQVFAAQAEPTEKTKNFAAALCCFFRGINKQLDEVAKCRNAQQAYIELKKIKNMRLSFDGANGIKLVAGSTEVVLKKLNHRIQAEVLPKLMLLTPADRCDVLSNVLRTTIVKIGKQLFANFDGADYAHDTFEANRLAELRAVTNYNALLTTVDQALAPLIAQQAQAPAVQRVPSRLAQPQIVQPAPKPVVAPQQPKASVTQPVAPKQSTQPVIAPKVPVVPQQTKTVTPSQKPQAPIQPVALKIEQPKKVTTTSVKPAVAPAQKKQPEKPKAVTPAIDLQALQAAMPKIQNLLAAKQAPVAVPAAQKAPAPEVKKTVQQPVVTQAIVKPAEPKAPVTQPVVQNTPAVVPQQQKRVTEKAAEKSPATKRTVPTTQPETKKTPVANVKAATPQPAQKHERHPAASQAPALATPVAFEKTVLQVIEPIKTNPTTVAQPAAQPEKANVSQEDVEPTFDVDIPAKSDVVATATPAESEQAFTLTPEDLATFAMLERATREVIAQEAFEKAHPHKQEQQPAVSKAPESAKPVILPDLALAQQQAADPVDIGILNTLQPQEVNPVQQPVASQASAPARPVAQKKVNPSEEIRSKALKNILATYQQESTSLPILDSKSPAAFIEEFLAPKGSEFNAHLCLLLTPGIYADQNIVMKLNGSLAHHFLSIISNRKNLQEALKKIEFDHKKYDQLSSILYTIALKNENPEKALVALGEMFQHAPHEGWKKFIEELQRPYDMILSLPQPPADVTINHLGDYVQWYLQDFAPSAEWGTTVEPQIKFLNELLNAAGYKKSAQEVAAYAREYLKQNAFLTFMVGDRNTPLEETGI